MRLSIAAAFASKNLYNQITYHYRQAFNREGIWLSYAEVFHRIKHLDCYQALPCKVSNAILIAVDKNWWSFRKALKAWHADPSSFTGKPKIPKYKHKERGRNILINNKQAIGLRAFKKTCKLVPSGLPIEIATGITWDQVDQVRIVPRANGYVVEVVYQQEVAQADVDPTMIAALDLGVNTLAACTSTKSGFQPLLINGRPLKSINQHYQSRLVKANRFTSRQLDRMTAKRNRRVNAYLHVASRRIIDHLVQEGIGTLVVGKNPLWKQQVEQGRKNNQTFVQIPHARFIDILMYKAKLVGIDVVIVEESYTSKASFLDLDALPTYDPERTEKPRFSGKRKKRGLYRASPPRPAHRAGTLPVPATSPAEQKHAASRVVDGKCPETSIDVALKPAHLPRMLNIRDPFSENVAKAADHGDQQLYIEEPAQSAGPRGRFCGKPAQDG